MKPTKIIWQIFPANLFILLFSVIAVTWYSSCSIEGFFLNQARESLETRCHLISSRVLDLAAAGDIDGMRNYVIQGGRESNTRISIISEAGHVLADSNERPNLMNNHSGRPEIHEAMLGQSGSSIRFSATVQDTLLYVAVPYVLEKHDGTTSNIIIRTSYSVASVYETLTGIKKRVALGSLGIIVIAILITLFISRNISRPLEELKNWAERFSLGDFEGKRDKLQSPNASLEVVSLAKTMEDMGESLEEKIETISSHRNQLETVFSSMKESLIAIDSDERIIAINNAAAQLFNTKTAAANNKYIHELTRNFILLENIQYVMKEGVPIETEIEFFNEDGTSSQLQTNIVHLQNSNNDAVGVLIVLNDVTQLRHLENIRRDFVANVSHELRTPITAIQGYVETLLDGAMHSPEDAKNFLGIILRQSTRLSAIIEDLLALSRIEQDSDARNIEFAEEHACFVLGAALQTCKIEADKKDISLMLHCPEDLSLSINAPLIEQALVNLIVNAIRYSPEQSQVIVATELIEDNSKVNITVSDSGCGISPEHLPRLFERFYRSDKARSRNVGGTGLGLSIVKHIVQAHGGTVSVASQEEKGTDFTITLPTLNS